MNWYAVMRIHALEGVEDGLYVFDTKAERDRFLKTGARYSYELIVPWETFPVRASEAREHAMVDGFGDRYANLYFGGVRYPWGHKGYDKWEREHDERS